MPWTSAVQANSSTAMTPRRPETSRPGADARARVRNRFDVDLASRTGSPAGIARYDARRLRTPSSCRTCPTRSLTIRNVLPGTSARHAPNDLDPLDHLGRVADRDDPCREVLGDHRAGADHGVGTDGDARADDHATAEPDVVADGDRF